MNEPARKPSLFQRKGGQAFTILLLAAIVLLLWVLLPFGCGCPLGPYSATLSALNSLRNNEKPVALVAHALGEIDGVFYTNSRDAFVLNYGRGFRTFEVDLVLLEDGSVLCAHDGSEWMYGLDKPYIETTAAEISGRLCLGKYTSLTGGDLLDLIDEYEDACFLLDAKRTTEESSHAILKALVSEARERCPSVLNRVIPHTFGPADLWEVAGIHRFSRYWEAVYSFTCHVDGDSRGEPDRIVVYGITDGGVARLRRIADIIDGCTPLNTALCGALCAFAHPAFGLTGPLWDTRLYVSVDIMDDDSTPIPA